MKTACIPAPISFSDDTVHDVRVTATTEESKVFTERTTVLRGEATPVAASVCVSSPNLKTREDMERYVRCVDALVRAGWPAAWAVQEADAEPR